jgi:uncharacterized protein
MADSRPKRCTVVFARPERQFEWQVELDGEATVADALESARLQAGTLEVAWDTCDVGIFGVPCPRSAVPREGDRIEIYRPLECDPKQARRDRVRRARSRGGRSGL